MTGEVQAGQQTAHRILGYIETLSGLKDVDAILDRVLFCAREFTGADAGSIYLVRGDHLEFSYVHNDTLFDHTLPYKEVYASGSVPIDEKSIVGFAAKKGQSVVIDDAYNLAPGLPYAFNPAFDNKTGYRTTSMMTIPLKSVQGKLVGVMQIINAQAPAGGVLSFGPETQAFVPLLAASAAAAIERGLMTRELILRMMKMAQLRDPKETGAHVMRVGAYSAEIYRRWAHNRLQQGLPLRGDWADLTKAEIENKIRSEADLLRLAAMLHDVGKVGIPDAILKKPAALSDEEFDFMKLHTIFGARLFAGSTSELDQMCQEIAIGHHEKWSGGGYPGVQPTGIESETSHGEPRVREEIPLTARIVALADVYDALCSKRSYKESWPEERVLAEIEKSSGEHFDPELVAAFVQIHEVILAIREKFSSDDSVA